MPNKKAKHKNIAIIIKFFCPRSKIKFKSKTQLAIKKLLFTPKILTAINPAKNKVKPNMIKLVRLNCLRTTMPTIVRPII